MFKTIQPIFSVVVGILIIAFFVRPMFSEIGVVQAETAQYKEAVAKAVEFNRLLGSLLAQKDAISALELERLDAMVPRTGIDEVKALDDLQALANEHNMVLEDISVQAEQLPQTTDAAGGAGMGMEGDPAMMDPALEPGMEPGMVEPGFETGFEGEMGVPPTQSFDASQLVTQDIELSLVGTYEQFQDFLGGLERSLVFMEVTNLSVEEGEGELTDYQVTVRLFALP